jgi:hypothetical protein
MNENFKKKLIAMVDDSTDPSGKSFTGEEMQKIIRFGAMGEMGDNYYLFLYRDFYRNAAYYGATLFFNKRDALENPVTVTGLEQNGKEQVRSVYVKAALYFLENNCQDTMTVASGNARTVFEMAKEKVNAFIGHTRAAGDQLEQFAFDIHHQQIQSREIESQKSRRKFHSRELANNLRKLEEEEKSPAETPEAVKIKAKLGLNLVSAHLDLSAQRQTFFQPLVLPLKSDGGWGKPQKTLKSNLPGSEYQWLETSPLLEQFFTFFLHLEKQPGNPRLKANLANQFFFQPLAEELFTLADDLTFCQVDNDKEVLPLKTLRFNKVKVRLAPSLKKDGVYRFFLTFFSSRGASLEARDNYEIILFEDRAYLRFTADDNERWFAVPETAEAARHFYRFFAFLAAQEEFYRDDLPEVKAALKKIESQYLTLIATPLKKYELRFLPIPVLNIYPDDERLDKPQRLEMEFDYREGVKEFLHQHPDKLVCTYQPDEEFEKRCLEVLKSDPLLIPQMDYHDDRRAVFHYYYFQENNFLEWLVKRGRKYLEKGFKIYSIKWKRYIANAGNSVRFHIASDIDWLEFKPYVHDPLTGLEYELEVDNHEPLADMVIDKKGMLHLVTQQDIDRLTQLCRFAESHAQGFRVPSRNFVLIRQLYDKKMEELPAVKEILTSAERLKEFEHIADYPLSTHFNGRLRSYQQEGFKWLYFLQDYRFSGCLADDMGLGKTVQTLALLQTLQDQKKLNTSLLVMPVSAIPNWEAEIQRFTPSLTYHRHIGANRDKNTNGWEKNHLVLTSYATMRNDIEMLQDFPFDYIILDESQNIKNLSSQVSKAAKILKGKNRLALSGTPIENNSMELWSLFDFLMPGFLGTYRWFNRQLAQAIEKENDPTKIQLLKTMIFPFVMRRKKEEVETELPEKIEIVSKLDMEEEQGKVYAETARFYRETLEKEIDEKGVAGASMKILEGMLRLRQICLFPQLASETFKEIPSAKFEYFKELLEDILAENHKVLIFSQFVQVLKILKIHCDRENICYSYIDGSVDIDTREQMVKGFQEDEGTRVFLLSLKAGGVALNLTAADYVIIFDPWWNPAVEAQAIDRSHRIGQSKKVLVYRMVVKESIEEKMLELQERKKTLVENLIASDTQAFKNLGKEDLLSLFQ